MSSMAKGELLETLLPGALTEPTPPRARRMPRRRGMPDVRAHAGELRSLPAIQHDSDLLDIRDAQISFRELLLAPSSLQTFAEVHLEYRREELLARHGMAPRRTMLFVGPPGTGKSAAAEAFADETGRDFALVNLATVVSSFLGDTARNLAAIFAAASERPLVLLFDEFDAIAKERAEASDHGELKRVVTAFLQLLERFQGPSILIAATNHPDLLDLAVWRRFDIVLPFAEPKVHEIRALLRRKLDPLPRQRGLDIERVASACKGLSQAEVTRVVSDAYRHHLLYAKPERPIGTEELLAAAQAVSARQSIGPGG
jgi:SpoVK/Ycf46/Vps4 family AAA+-type ATPase